MIAPDGTEHSRRASTRVTHILLVEDNPADVRLISDVFRDYQIANTLTVLSDGEKALAYLKSKTLRGGKPRPDLMLLDLNMPTMNGHELLAEIKNDPKLCMIPVVVLTTSGSQDDVKKSYSLQASCHIVKPLDLDEFIETIEKIKDFFLRVARLPQRL